MRFSLTKAGLQPLFRALFFPSEAKDMVWSLCRGTPVLATDDRAEQQTPLYLPCQQGWVLGSQGSQGSLEVHWAVQELAELSLDNAGGEELAALGEKL